MSKYTTEALSCEAQADQLLGRSLVGNRDQIIQRLREVNDYRLSGYLHPYRKVDAQGELLREYCDIPLKELGLPDRWWQHPVWDPTQSVPVIPLHPKQDA